MLPSSKITDRDIAMANLQFQKFAHKATAAAGGTVKEQIRGLSADMRFNVYSYLNQSDLILKVAKLSRSERQLLAEKVQNSDSYASSSMMNQRNSASQ